MQVPIEFAEDFDLVCQFFELAPGEVDAFRELVKTDFERIAPSVRADARVIRAYAPGGLPGSFPEQFKHLSPFLAAQVMLAPVPAF